MGVRVAHLPLSTPLSNRFRSLEHYKKFIKTEKEFTKRQKDRVKNSIRRLSHHEPALSTHAPKPGDKDHETKASSPKDSRWHTLRQHKAAEDESWFANAAWRRDILYGRSRKPSKEAEREGEGTVEKVTEPENALGANGSQQDAILPHNGGAGPELEKAH